MAKSKKNSSNRRGFLKGAAAGVAAGAAALVTNVSISEAQQSVASVEAAPIAVPPPTQAQLERDGGSARPPAAVRGAENPGSDLMVQVLRDLGVEYVASNPGSSFEGIQESIINYGKPPNVMPEFITALHEMSAVDMAHGYGKAEGKPMVAMLHGTLGIQNAAMAIYQAYYDRTPVLLLVGRDEGFIQAHTAHDMAAMCRSFTKWDATAKTLGESLTAIQRAYAEAMAPPQGPTLVVLDMEHQKEEVKGMRVPAYQPPQISGLDATRTREIAKRLVDAQNPRIAVGRLRTPQGVKSAVELAELVGATPQTGR
jgi:acetolactate synthase I/II/III large subunit